VIAEGTLQLVALLRTVSKINTSFQKKFHLCFHWPCLIFEKIVRKSESAFIFLKKHTPEFDDTVSRRDAKMVNPLATRGAKLKMTEFELWE
jgi:hypothetical protein